MACAERRQMQLVTAPTVAAATSTSGSHDRPPALAPDASKRATPAVAASARTDAALQLVAPPEWRRPQPKRHTRTASAEQRVRQVLEAQPDISTRALAKPARVSDSTASKHRALWRQERAQQGQAGQVAQ